MVEFLIKQCHFKTKSQSCFEYLLGLNVDSSFSAAVEIHWISFNEIVLETILQRL